MQKSLCTLTLTIGVLINLVACSNATSQTAGPGSKGEGCPSLDKFYDRINAAGKEGGNLSIDPSFILNASFSGKENSAGWMSKITLVRLLLLNDKRTPAREEEWRDLFRSLQRDEFEEWLTIRQGADRVQLLSKERADGQKEVVFLAGDKEGGGLLLHFRGRFTAADMEKIQDCLRSKQSLPQDQRGAPQDN